MSCPTLPFSFRQGKRSAKGRCHSRIVRTQERVFFTFILFICNTGAKLHIYYIRDVIFKEKIRRNIHVSTFNDIPKGNAYLYCVISKK